MFRRFGGSDVSKEHFTLWESKVLFHAHTSPPFIHLNILPSTPRSSKWRLFFRCHPLYACLLPHTLYMPHPSHLLWCDPPPSPQNGWTAPWGPRPPHFSRLHDHTLFRHTTLGRTPLDEGPARRRDLYLTSHNTHKRQTSMSSAGFEPTILVSEGIDITKHIKC
jgi:hypothetical protein